jgi:hypothetical protein
LPKELKNSIDKELGDDTSITLAVINAPFKHLDELLDSKSAAKQE